MRKKILVTRKYPEKGIRLLEKHGGFDLTLWDKQRPMTQEELIDQAKNHDALLCTLTEKITKDFLAQCSHLDIISQFAVGFDNIDIPAATSAGIPVGYTPDAMTNATADTAFGLMIAVSRKMFFMHKTIIDGSWGYFDPTAHLGVELSGKTLGIFGLGRIGQAMAKKCRAAYDMNIIYNGRTPRQEAEKQLGAVFVSFEELLAQSDVLSVHCALTDETRGKFNFAAFSRMKPSAIFINTARGAVHNEKDLIRVMKEKLIWGTGLDVTDPEPMSADNPLLSMENACVLPHIGSATLQAREQMSVMAANNIIEFYTDGNASFIVNPIVLEK